MLKMWRTLPRGGVADHDEAPREQAITNDSSLSVVFAYVIDFDGNAVKRQVGILEVQATVLQCAQPLRWIERYAQQLL